MTQRRKLLYELLGDLPERDRQVSVARKIVEERPAYVLEKLMLDLNGIELVPAYFVRPKGLVKPAPAMLYNHAHGGRYDIGKEEFLRGLDALQSPPYADEITRRGWCGLCIDAWNFGERRGRTEGELFKEMLWKGRVLWGMMMYDSLRATDYLVSRPEVDPKRICTAGLSMGSTMSWWLAALDERIKVCVDICCLTDFHTLVKTRGLDGHGLYYFVPSLLKQFTTSQINALIAPRAHLSLAGNYDKLTPPEGLDAIDGELKKVYAKLGARNAWKLVRYDIGHFETAAMRAEIFEFLQKHV